MNPPQKINEGLKLKFRFDFGPELELGSITIPVKLLLVLRVAKQGGGDDATWVINIRKKKGPELKLKSIAPSIIILLALSVVQWKGVMQHEWQKKKGPKLKLGFNFGLKFELESIIQTCRGTLDTKNTYWGVGMQHES